MVSNGSHLTGWRRYLSYLVPLEMVVLVGMIYLTSRREMGDELPEINKKLRIIQAMCLLSIIFTALAYLQLISQGKTSQLLHFLSNNLLFVSLGPLMRLVYNLVNGWTISSKT